MRMGIFLGQQGSFDGSFPGLVNCVVDAEQRGFSHVWLGDSFGFDALSTLSAVSARTTRIRLGTAVLPIQTRHPVTMAREANTLNLACGDRLDLGLGVSHRFVVEQLLGGTYRRPAAQMREYVQILKRLMEGRAVTYRGDFYRVDQVALSGMPLTQFTLSIAALRPRMLELAAALDVGTITFMTGPATLERRIATSGVPRIAAMFPILLTNDTRGGREFIDGALKIYGMTPSYRAMLDEEHQAGPGDNAMVGSETDLLSSIHRLRDIGVTDFIAAIVAQDGNAYRRTLEFLTSAT